ncbi:MAG TPA: methyl-accepting chemotaxis protein [Syntrophales bacterium]|nr:methyl-accepting chemotaxis protein [Syntrophales bacterium]
MPDSIRKIKLADRDYFQKAQKGEINVSNVYLSRTTGKPAPAVEAARPGESGVGFALVADEVRNLPMRAAEAARNTESLIENTRSPRAARAAI